MKDVRKAAQYLFSEIGNVEDALLYEAIRPRVQATRYAGARMRRVILLAAVLGVAASLILGAFVIGFFEGSKSEDALRDENAVIGSEPKDYHTDLAVLLLDAEKGTGVQRLAADQIDLFDGKSKVIWQSEGQTDYCVKSLASTEADKKLQNAVGNDDPNPVGKTPTVVRVWFCLGDGRVVSPYLSVSEGNVGYGVLFDYEPESIPSEDLVRTVEDLIYGS